MTTRRLAVSDLYAFGTLLLSAVIAGWLVRYLISHVDESCRVAAESRIQAMLERERCEKILNECRQAAGMAEAAAAAAHDAANAAEDAVGELPDDDDEDDHRF